MRTEESDYVPLTANCGPKQRMLFFQIAFDELLLDGLQNAGDLSRGIPETDRRKIKCTCPSVNCQRPSSQLLNHQIMVANGHLENPSTFELLLEVGDEDFQENFGVIAEKKPIITVLDGIVMHSDLELELDGVEEGDVIPVLMTSPTATRPGNGTLSSLALTKGPLAITARNKKLSKKTVIK